mmetsp:Transcript_33188/g.89877  ORF Transcript_33188/g.89877 Transcript_33188/m.89877 type:complete len:226 (+) Transcript_33188:2610-3287(+)
MVPLKIGVVVLSMVPAPVRNLDDRVQGGVHAGVERVQVKYVGELAARSNNGGPLALHEHAVHGPLQTPRDRVWVHGGLILVVDLLLQVRDAAHEPLVDGLSSRVQVIALGLLEPVQPFPTSKGAQHVGRLSGSVLVHDDVGPQDHHHTRPGLDVVWFHVVLADNPELERAPGWAQEVEHHEPRAGENAQPPLGVLYGQVRGVVRGLAGLDQHAGGSADKREAQVR